MSYKKLAQDQHAQPTSGRRLTPSVTQQHAREENIRWYEMCGADRAFALHKSANEGERIRKFAYVRKGKR